MMRILIALATALAVIGPCFAESVLVDDINHCKWRDGRKIPESQCEDLQDKLADVSDRIAQLKKELADPNTADWQRKQAQKGWGELAQYAKDLMDHSFKISKGKAGIGEESRDVAGSLMWLPRDPDVMTPQEAEEAKEQAALKRKCGKDYLAIRLGMTLARLQECHGAVYETETATRKGTIQTWRTIHDWVFVQNGVVTGITPRTD